MALAFEKKSYKNLDVQANLGLLLVNVCNSGENA